jgi:hypothetical protein
MAKYTFICEEDCGKTVKMEFNEISLPEVLQEFEFFLLASGYVLKGSVIISEDEE